MIQQRNNELLHRLQPGDHIIRRTGELPFVEDHHGIYVGNNEVVHYCIGEDINILIKGEVRTDIFATFAETDPVYLIPHDDLKRTKEEIAALAQHYAARRLWYGEYHRLLKNSSHFAHHCLGVESNIFKVRGFEHHDQEIGKVSVGEVTVKTEGVGVRGNATFLKDDITIGDVPVTASLGTTEVGVKVWEEDVGLDLGFKANARLGAVSVGPLSAELGPSLDTGVKFGKDGVGLTILGFGGEIGRKTNVQFLGLKLGFDFS
uniref:LRAT domain-containing protein n=1 Tax=Panagrellus redivivus TaxID=6233 RepID=A0A7E4VTW3_PANRE